MGSENARDDNTLKKNHKGSLFKGLFNEPQHFIDLYKECSGKQLREEDIEQFGLGADYINRLLYNDVSYLTKDNRLIIMVEHQSTPNPNMPLREAMYYFELLRIWLTMKKKDLSARAYVEAPTPEFYVAYLGDKSYNMQSLSFIRSFLSIECKLVDISFEKLKGQEPGNSLAGYAYFYKKYNEMKDQGASSEQAFGYAVRECMESGYLAGVVNKEGFVVDYMPIFSRDDELRYEGELIGELKGELKEKAKADERMLNMLRMAIAEKVPESFIKKMAEESGISPESLSELIEEASRQ